MAELALHGPAGPLQARHDAPAVPAASASAQAAAPAWRAAVVCHPHPLHGGTMDNKVVFTLAKALRERGLHVLRFNFRGVGTSAGVHDAGRGEVDDARAALDAASRLAAASPDAAAAAGAAGRAAADAAAPVAPGALLMAGFSFGAFVGLSAALADPRVGALLAVAPPVNHYDFSAIAATDKPLAVVYARDDELVPAADVEAFLARCARLPHARRVDGCGHLFHGHLHAVRRALDELLHALG